MPAKWDGPSSGHVGFGYSEHRRAGLPFRQPRSTEETNAILASERRLRLIADAAKASPEFQKAAMEMFRYGRSEFEIAKRLGLISN